MADYDKGGFVRPGLTTIRNDTDEPIMLSPAFVAYFSPQALEKYGREFLEEMFPGAEIEEVSRCAECSRPAT